MNKNIIIVLAGAIIAAVLVALLVQMTMGGKDDAPAPIANMIEVLVAAKDLKAGHELGEGDMRWKEWPEGSLFKGAVVRKEGKAAHEILEGRLERDFVQDEAITRRSLLKDTSGNFVAARLQPGERAMSIRVDAESMVAGFIRPGNYVDVILTFKQRIAVDSEEPQAVKEMIERAIDNTATETILENVRVLAVDQKSEVEEEDKIKVGKTVTLAVKIDEAEKLALGSEMGVLTLAMRGVGDDLPNKKAESISDARLIKIDDEIYNAYHELKKDSGIDEGTVKIYNGSAVQEVPLR